MTQYTQGLQRRVLAVLLAVAAAFVLVATLVGDETQTWQAFVLNLGTEMAGAVVTYVLLQRVIGGWERKQELIADLGSNVNDVAVHAAYELRRHGWLTDGSLQGAYLRDANLQGAYLRDANLQGAKLDSANLQEANLWDANLQGAYLTDANLQGAILWMANLQGAILWMANLGEADLREAHLKETFLLQANLSGANLWQANLRGPSFGRPTYKEPT